MLRDVQLLTNLCEWRIEKSEKFGRNNYSFLFNSHIIKKSLNVCNNGPNFTASLSNHLTFMCFFLWKTN
jgi:hypothetical protein